MQKAKYYSLWAVRLLSILTLVTTLAVGKPSAEAGTIPPALSGVGINTIALWSGASNVTSAERFAQHIGPVQRLGFDHLTIVACADWIVGVRCKKSFQNRAEIIKFVNTAIAATDLHVVLVLKGYDQKRINGINQSTLQHALESDEKAKAAFSSAWAQFAKEFSSIPASRLSFNLLNEPEFELPEPTNAKRKIWEEIAIRAISEIRSISPDRTIIYEGIAKAAHERTYRRNRNFKYASVDLLMKPIPFDNIVYGGRAYEPIEFTQQATYRGYDAGNAFSRQDAAQVRRGAERLIAWARKHNVPAMIGEFGCISYTDGVREGPAEQDDCGQYAEAVVEAYTKQGIGVTWWALEKEKTIFKRLPSDACSKKRQCPYWLPRRLVPDPYLMSGLKLSEKALSD